MASTILRPLAARTALYLYYTRTSGKGKRFLPVSILFRNRHFITTSSKWQALSALHRRHAGSPLPFFQYGTIIQVSGKMASIFFYIICLPFSGIHV